LFPKNADLAALKNDRPLMRCAAQSERISVVGTPQSFSVYDLKNWLNSQRPKRFDTHCSKVSSRPFGLSRAHRYDSSALVRSTGPSFLITSGPRSG
jgi:hypothetical protein